MKIIAAVAGALLSMSLALPSAAVDTVTARDPQTVMDALREIGYAPEMDPLSSGRPRIKVRISGSPSQVIFYNCDKELKDCYTLLFQYGMDLRNGTTLEKANGWNADQIAGRLWLDKNNDPWLDWAVMTRDGLPMGTFRELVKYWDRQIGLVKDYLDF